MIRRHWNHVVKLLAGAVLLAALGAGLVIAQAEDEDRPPIIVHNGSLIFDGGEGTNVRPWAKDAFLGEWKPRHDEAKGVRALAVTFAAVTSPSACATSTMSGEEVRIEYRVSPNGNPLAEMRVHLRRKHLIGKKEPKIDSNGARLNAAQITTGTPPTPVPALVYDDNPSLTGGSTFGSGWISKVTVDGTPCAFVKPPNEAARLAFRVRIQPKKAQ